MAAKILKMSEDNTIRFIELYRNESVLWDPTLANYKSRDHRTAAARRIVSALGIKGFAKVHVISKFKNLRSSYLQELKKIDHSKKSGSAADEIYKPKVIWFQLMDSFLRQHVKSRSTLNLPVNSKNEPKYLEEMTYGDENTSPGPDEFANPFEESEISLDAPPVLERSDAPLVLERSNATEPKSSALPQTANKAASRVDFDFINEAITRLEEVTARTKTCSRLGDLDAFGHYVVASLRCLKSDTALQAQIEIREIVERALEEIVLGDDAADEFTEVYERIHGDVPHTAAIPDQNGISHVDDSGQTSHAANSKSKPNDDGIENHDPLHPGSSLPPNSTETTASRVPDLTSTSEPNRKRKRLTSRSDVINHVLNKVDCMMDEVKNGQSDQYELLGRYITDSLQKMPPPLALRVQKDLYSVVIKYKLGSLENNNISDTL